jgi:hypothetical protein
VPIEQTLARVDDDLAHGRVLPALNRLRGVARSAPERLDVRERLAAVYRSQGEAAQAGRWAYLTEKPGPAEIEAFERQFRTATERLRALAWSGDDAALSAMATARLAALRSAADAERQSTASSDDDGNLGCVVAAVLGIAVALATLALLVVGVVTVVGWLAG